MNTKIVLVKDGAKKELSDKNMISAFKNEGWKEQTQGQAQQEQTQGQHK